MAKKKSKQTSLPNKWILIGVAFVILFVIFYAALPKQTIAPTQTTNNNSSSETANWKTYVNSQENFSFKYPYDWKLDTQFEPTSVTVISPNEAKDKQIFHISFDSETTQKSLNEWLKDKTIGGFCCAVNFELSPGPIINGVEFQIVSSEKSKYPGYVAKIENQIYYIYSQSGSLDGGSYYFDENDSVLMQNINTFSQILSTFKFTQ